MRSRKPKKHPITKSGVTIHGQKKLRTKRPLSKTIPSNILITLLGRMNIVHLDDPSPSTIRSRILGVLHQSINIR